MPSPAVHIGQRAERWQHRDARKGAAQKQSTPIPESSGARSCRGRRLFQVPTEKRERTYGPPPHLVGHILLSEGLRVEAQAQGSHKLPWGREPCSSTSTPPWSHAALPHPSATSPGADGMGQPCPGGGDACCLQLAGSRGLASARTPTAQPGTALSDNFSPKGLGNERHTNRGTPVPGCACTTAGKRSRAGLRVGARKGLAFANEPPQVKSSTRRQVAYRNQLTDQKKQLNFLQRTDRQDPTGSSMALGARWGHGNPHGRQRP